uniref:peptidylprolyl isomerase n=1 Tax=Chromera velia CCMP2878 TaxID=1169474 RepID=A0A0G4F6J2_9ALVE|eukprot:Cvel_15455.t1-p1 / transcript=Cvel_15455.t1 / gene=Cvel_15455 / organism=Chromera_velia_CCMP2878 / gene_product=Peptidyl-prolyl cis-trans isomerase FKBP12, putative / transcript_product=Peptidyl-prolyl cis-trans isomerase FKBP12, putative / location=Cvel_scaffold1144:50326-51884(-) / protein_length=117 / sequence_SO=supercontig / SO=protein_coding / is_pseudo=false
MSLTKLKKETLKEGTGRVAEKGNTVTCHALGQVLNADGSLSKFWSTKDAGQQPFTFQAGCGQVIAGWDQGALGMKEGEAAKLMIPSDMGYGEGGFPAWGIPPNADLCFEIEVISVSD